MQVCKLLKRLQLVRIPQYVLSIITTCEMYTHIMYIIDVVLQLINDKFIGETTS